MTPFHRMSPDDKDFVRLLGEVVHSKHSTHEEVDEAFISLCDFFRDPQKDVFRTPLDFTGIEMDRTKRLELDRLDPTRGTHKHKPAISSPPTRPTP